MISNSVATAADYADALMSARRAKTWITLALLLILLFQLTLFFLVRFNQINLEAGTISIATSATQPATEQKSIRLDMLRYVLAGGNLIGIVLAVLLAVVLMLILKIMLVGRLIGAGRVTSAYIWSLLLVLLMFPWQVFMSESDQAGESFKIPGVLYTWTEIKSHSKFDYPEWHRNLLKWARFVGFPAVALLILLFPVTLRSNRGLRLAMGESELALRERDDDIPLGQRPL